MKKNTTEEQPILPLITEPSESKQIQHAEAEAELVPTNLYANDKMFAHAQRVATMFSKSDLVPKQFQGNIGNCVIALEMSNRIGASPLMVMQNMYIVHGKPAWSSTFLIATVNACGKFSPLRYDEDAKEGGRTRAWAIDLKNNERVFGTWVSMNMAEAEGWIQKAGSKWKTMPDLMRRYRAASFFARQFAPEVSMGILTEHEVHDTPFTEIKPEQEHAELTELFELKRDALTESETLDAERILNDREVKSYGKLQKYLQGL